jgi:lipopolysaccharide assembly outer membrane protein LptD (OstA)
VEFGGDIDIRATGGRRFTAKQARFQTDTDKLICEGGVAWNAGRYSAAADKLVIDVRNKKIRLRGNVKLTART